MAPSAEPKLEPSSGEATNDVDVSRDVASETLYEVPEALKKNIARAINYETSMVDQFSFAVSDPSDTSNILPAPKSTTDWTSSAVLVPHLLRCRSDGHDHISVPQPCSITKAVHNFRSIISNGSDLTESLFHSNGHGHDSSQSCSEAMVSSADKVGAGASSPSHTVSTYDSDDPGVATGQNRDRMHAPSSKDGTVNLTLLRARIETKATQSKPLRHPQHVPIQDNESTKTSTSTRTRRSNREQKKKEAALVVTRIRYDMELVPYARVNRQFLSRFRSVVYCPSTRSSTSPKTSSCIDSLCNAYLPFDSHDNEHGSSIWIPTKRSEWNDSVHEMAALCMSAGLRKFKGEKPFVVPLAEAYIRDRVDIDDPLRGYQIRHSNGGWLQGFITWTNFTTWTHFFRWDSLHPASGIPGSVDPSSELCDIDGKLAEQLERLPRQGNPADKGIVFGNIAEIALLGGLGCGELLVRMALAEISCYDQYRYVVVQATDGSKSFYEKLGFRRVGAVCKYGQRKKNTEVPPTADSPDQGYRHWTHANESQESLDLHGGPSSMMCLELRRYCMPRAPDAVDNPSEIIESSRVKQSVLLSWAFQQLIMRKPTIEPLGNSASNTPKKRSKHRVSGLSPSSGSARRSLSLTASSEAAMSPRGPNYSQSLSTLLSPPRISCRSRRRAVGEGASLSRKQSQRAGKKRRIEVLSPLAATQENASDSANSSDEYVQAKRTTRASNARTDTVQRDGMTAERVQRGPKKHIGNANPANRDGEREASVKKARVDAQHLDETAHGIHIVDRSRLVKQRVKSYPRDRVHYYNKVVKNKKNGQGKQQRQHCENIAGSDASHEYFFVLHYDEEEGTLKIVPMEARGKLSGRRAGRPRYQCVIEDTDSNFETVRASDYEAVSAFMVMKTPYVAQEAWDILD